MNPAIFASSFHPHFGGVEELARQLALQLKATGNAPVVFTNRWPKNLARYEEFEGLPIRRYLFRVPERTFRQLSTSLIFGGLTLRNVVNDLRQLGTDVLHIQCVSSQTYYALAARRELQLPLVVTLQGELTMDAGQLFQKSRFAQSLLRRALDEADLITGCSAKTLFDAEAFYGESFGDRARVIFNGAAITDFGTCKPFTHPRPYMFAIGRIVPQKGFDVLLRAYAKSGVRSHDLVIAGDGPARADLESLARELGVAESVHFLGRADRNLVPSLFRGASFFVLPSRTDEGMPVVCAEAMAAGKAVIATRAGGAPEAILDEINGIIVPREDIDALATALSRIS
ncbi:MAG: glycosyltransferase family 4 protein, partial [Chloroflexia bacterium]